MKFLLFLILSITIFKPHPAIGQPKLATGLYLLNNDGRNTLTLNGKTYHTNTKPIALLKDMNSFSVTKAGTANDYYNLNIELNTEVSQALKKIPYTYGQITYIGLIIQGKLVVAPRWGGPVTTGKVSISSKSKSGLEQIAAQLKTEKAKNQ